MFAAMARCIPAARSQPLQSIGNGPPKLHRREQQPETPPADSDSSSAPSPCAAAEEAAARSPRRVLHQGGLRRAGPTGVWRTRWVVLVAEAGAFFLEAYVPRASAFQVGRAQLEGGRATERLPLEGAIVSRAAPGADCPRGGGRHTISIAIVGGPIVLLTTPDARVGSKWLASIRACIAAGGQSEAASLLRALRRWKGRVVARSGSTRDGNAPNAKRSGSPALPKLDRALLRSGPCAAARYMDAHRRHRGRLPVARQPSEPPTRGDPAARGAGRTAAAESACPRRVGSAVPRLDVGTGRTNGLATAAREKGRYGGDEERTVAVEVQAGLAVELEAARQEEPPAAAAVAALGDAAPEPLEGEAVASTLVEGAARAEADVGAVSLQEGGMAFAPQEMRQAAKAVESAEERKDLVVTVPAMSWAQALSQETTGGSPKEGGRNVACVGVDTATEEEGDVAVDATADEAIRPASIAVAASVRAQPVATGVAALDDRGAGGDKSEKVSQDADADSMAMEALSGAVRPSLTGAMAAQQARPESALRRAQAARRAREAEAATKGEAAAAHMADIRAKVGGDLERGASRESNRQRCGTTHRLRSLCSCDECCDPQTAAIEAAQDEVWALARQQERAQELAVLTRQSAGCGAIGGTPRAELVHPQLARAQLRRGARRPTTNRTLRRAAPSERLAEPAAARPNGFECPAAFACLDSATPPQPGAEPNEAAVWRLRTETLEAQLAGVRRALATAEQAVTRERRARRESECRAELLAEAEAGWRRRSEEERAQRLGSLGMLVARRTAHRDLRRALHAWVSHRSRQRQARIATAQWRSVQRLRAGLDALRLAQRRAHMARRCQRLAQQQSRRSLATWRMWAAAQWGSRQRHAAAKARLEWQAPSSCSGLRRAFGVLSSAGRRWRAQCNALLDRDRLAVHHALHMWRSTAEASRPLRVMQSRNAALAAQLEELQIVALQARAGRTARHVSTPPVDDPARCSRHASTCWPRRRSA